LNKAATATFVNHADVPMQLLTNTSTTGVVRQAADDQDGKYAYLAPRVNAFNVNIDYIGTSLAVHSQCAPVTARCIKSISGVGAKYQCDFAMEGYIYTDVTNRMSITYFTDSTLSSNLTSTIPMSNPYYFAAVVSVNQNFGRPKSLPPNTDITSGGHGSTLFVLLCNTTILDWEYTSVNGTITDYSTQRSNSSTTNVVMSTQGYTQIGDPFILQRTSLDVWQSHTAQEIANNFAYIYSQTALAAAGGAFVPRPALEAQLRSSILVAKVSKAPLACLLLANLLLVLLAILLTVVAFRALDDDVGDVQARLSIDALVAAQFETNGSESMVEHIHDMFDEHKGLGGPRVGAKRTVLNGWSLGIIRRDSNDTVGCA
jgi:hypothetical protein